MRKKRLPRAGAQVKMGRVEVGRRLVALPRVRSMMSESVAPATTPGDGKAEKPANEPSEELTRMIKKAYQ